MYNSIKLKVKRNARFFLFEMEPVTRTANHILDLRAHATPCQAGGGAGA